MYISLNRFVPAFRAVFFVAAGFSRLALWEVLLFGCFSAALWNGVILGVGYAVGYKLETLAAIVGTYSRFFMLGAGLLVAVWLIRTIYQFIREDSGD